MSPRSPKSPSPLVIPHAFLQSARDAGYRSTSMAVAELIDNALEAGARTIEVRLVPPPQEAEAEGGQPRAVELSVTDDGAGMDEATLALALAFGGSSRFGSREGMGRFGVGLVNAGLSQARRIDVYTWRDGSRPRASTLDLDEIVERKAETIPLPRARNLPLSHAPSVIPPSGTMVVLSKLDRLDFAGRVVPLADRLRRDIGRVYRRFLAEGVRITVAGEPAVPIDPLFLAGGEAREFGAPAVVDIPLPDKPGVSAKVTVRCSILPAEWQRGRSNGDGVPDKALLAETQGISVVRAGREIDIVRNPWQRPHWTDRYIRVEVSFGPELDEIFGVHNTKQGVNLAANSAAATYLEPFIQPRVTQMREVIVKRRKRKAAKPAAAAAKPAAPVPVATFKGSPDVPVRVEGGEVRVNTAHPFHRVWKSLRPEARSAVEPILVAIGTLDAAAMRKVGKALKAALTAHVDGNGRAAKK